MFRLTTPVLLVAMAVAAPAAAASPRQVTTDPARDWDPSWSPDGSRLLFTSDRSGFDQLWTISASGEDPQRITGEPAYHPAWSPDGRLIAFTSERSGNQDIWTVRADGQSPRQITVNPARDETLGWSHRGERITFDSNRSGNWDIWTIPAQGGTATRLTDHPALDAGPTGSRDGSRIAFTSSREGPMDLWVIPSDGGTARRLSSGPHTDVGPDWSPDDELIAFGTDRNGNWDIWLIPSDGGRPWPLVSDAANDLYPAWSPDGSRISFSSDRGGHSDVWILDLVGVTGCVALSGDPLADARVRLSQAGRPKRWADTGPDGCFSHYALREGKKFKLRISGNEIAAQGTELAACFSLDEHLLAGRKVVLKQPGGGTQRRRTDADGCVLFENLTAGPTFNLTLKGPRAVAGESAS